MGGLIVSCLTDSKPDENIFRVYTIEDDEVNKQPSAAGTKLPDIHYVELHDLEQAYSNFGCLPQKNKILMSRYEVKLSAGTSYILKE